MSVTFERIGPARDWLGESPVWNPKDASAYWIDSRSGILRRHNPSTGKFRSWQLPCEIGAIGLAGTGKIFAALRNAFYQIDLETGELAVIDFVRTEEEAQLRPHDIGDAARLRRDLQH